MFASSAAIAQNRCEGKNGCATNNMRCNRRCKINFVFPKVEFRLPLISTISGAAYATRDISENPLRDFEFALLCFFFFSVLQNLVCFCALHTCDSIAGALNKLMKFHLLVFQGSLHLSVSPSAIKP